MKIHFFGLPQLRQSRLPYLLPTHEANPARATPVGAARRDFPEEPHQGARWSRERGDRDLRPSSGQDVNVIHQHSQTFYYPAIPHPYCTEVPSRAGEHPRRGTCATRSSQKHRGGGDSVGGWIGYPVCMHLPGRTSLPLERASETVERLERRAFPDIRCGCAEARYESSSGRLRCCLTIATRNPHSGHWKIRRTVTPDASEPP